MSYDSGDRNRQPTSANSASARLNKSSSKRSTSSSDDDDDNECRMDTENQSEILRSQFSNRNDRYDSDSPAPSPIKTPKEKKSSPKSNQSSDEWICDNCDASNDKNIARCTNCREFSRSSSISSPPIEKTPKEKKSSPKSNQSSDEWICSHCKTSNDKKVERCRTCRESIRPYSVSSPPIKQTPKANKSSSTWICAECNHTNSSNEKSCSECGEGCRPSEDVQKVSNDLAVQPQVKSAKLQKKPSNSSIIAAVSEKGMPVFIPEIPHGSPKSMLKNTIQSRLDMHRDIFIQDIICYTKACAGVVIVKSEDDADSLVKRVQSIVLDPKTEVTIKFIDELELISYIVFDKTAKSSVNSDDIIREWKQRFNLPYKCQCKTISKAFPNIFRLTIEDAEELAALDSLTEFTVCGSQAKLYLNADCSFFEDLPEKLSKKDIAEAVCSEIERAYDENIMYIQYDGNSSSAVIISTNAVNECRKMTKIHLQNEKFKKKDSLKIRDKSVDDDAVKKNQNDSSHGSKKTGIKPKDQPKSANAGYDPDDIRKESDSPTSMKKSKTKEIDEQTWYETEMVNYRPELGDFLSNPDLPIFKLKWNSQCWLNQFKRFQGSKTDKPRDEQRLLRISVMANTIGVLKQKYYVLETDDRESRVNLRLQRMTNIVYDHQSKLMKKGEIDLTEIRLYSETKVKVVQKDCLVVYEDLLRKNRKPVLLNMANSKTPGGGYRRGAGAQEENIFRRSNYCLSLDVELDENNEMERLRCTSDGNNEPIGKQGKLYPIDNYGAIYTSDITVFRGTESEGYAFLEEPIYGVCAIASAACERPKLRENNSKLQKQAAIDMQKKIENFFAIALLHKHDCLVLSAFGCGAFQNPPGHVATIYKAVIEQYAGYFKEIHFAIIDDNNTRREHNPDGNYEPFKKTLNGFKCEPPSSELTEKTTGPFRIIRKSGTKLTVDDVKIDNSSDSSDQSEEDEQRSNSPLHKKESQSDPRSKLTEDKCPDDNRCVRFHDKQHVNKQKHSFQPPCPLTPYACEHHAKFLQAGPNKPVGPEIEKHCNEFSHVCPFGQQCRNNDPAHLRISIHITRRLCQDGSNCKKLFDEEHLNSFSHSDIRDVRSLCHYCKSQCQHIKNREHINRFRHEDNSCDQLGVVPYSDSNRQIDFFLNQSKMVQQINRYLESNNTTYLKEIRRCVQAAQPVYRCSQSTLESIIAHGCVMSRKYVQDLQDPKNVIRAALQHFEIRKILDECKAKELEQKARQYIEAIVQNEFDQVSAKNQATGYAGGSMYGTPNNSSPNQSQLSNKLRTIESSLKKYLSSDAMKNIQQHASLITQTHFRLLQEPENAIRHDDKLFRTNEHVVCTLGPSSNKNGDIVIVFKREIMHHPDSNFTPQAATSFARHDKAYHRLPWLSSPKTDEEAAKYFHRSKLHYSIHKYDETAALLLIALVKSTKTASKFDLQSIREYWKKTDSDEVFEAHLPYSVPLDYIGYIFMSDDTYRSLGHNYQNFLSTTFKDRLKKIDDKTTSWFDYFVNFFVNLDLITPNDNFNKNVHGQIQPLTTKNNSSTLCGTLITLKSTKFADYVCLPFTVTQINRSNQNGASSTDGIYIYWEAFGGDMMLAISKNRIEQNKDQFDNPSLLCYIADIPTENNNTHENRESYSYITNGPSDQHRALVKSPELKAKSSTFHYGCNIYDFIRYCLKIDYNKDEITLTHAGSNEVYNKEEIVYKFDRTEFDLRELGYIHLSANRSNVPIRNLIVSQKRIDDCHLSADTNSQRRDRPSVPSSPHIDFGNFNPHVPGFCNPLQKNRQKQGVFPPHDNSPNHMRPTPCRYGVNCPQAYNKNVAADSHNIQYSHLCQYYNSCTRKAEHSYFEHNPNSVPECKLQSKCSQLADPYHRCQYRHANLPDILFPCNAQSNCQDQSDRHRQKYSHGEMVQPPQDPSKSNY